MKVLVTGATGTVGRAVVLQLVADGVPVRAMTRNPARADLPREAEVVRGDLTSPADIEAAIRGVDAVFLVWTAPPDAAPAAIGTIARHAKRIVYLTAPHRTAHPFFQQPNAVQRIHAANESLVECSGLTYGFVRPGMFAANSVGWWSDQIRRGDVIRWPYAEAATAPIDERDIAAVAVHALRDDRNVDYVITGPVSMTHREQAQTLADVLGRTLRYEELTPDQARRELGFPAAAMDMLLNAWAAAVGRPAFVTNTVEEVTGSGARPFREWAADNAWKFGR